MADESSLSKLHYEIVRGLIDSGCCPSNAELADRLAISVADLEQLLRALADIHGVVLHPHVCEPWVVHPFSLTPTLHWVEGRQRGWWAPCVWCALGIATLAGGDTRIHTRLAGEAEPTIITVVDGQPSERDLWVHFAIPPAKAWKNVHQHCAMVLAFRSPDEIARWCETHHLPHGEAVRIDTVADLARRWYGSHASPEWRKWTIAEAQAIFREAGLDSPFWNLDEHAAVASGKF